MRWEVTTLFGVGGSVHTDREDRSIGKDHESRTDPLDAYDPPRANRVRIDATNAAARGMETSEDIIVPRIVPRGQGRKELEESCPRLNPRGSAYPRSVESAAVCPDSRALQLVINAPRPTIPTARTAPSSRPRAGSGCPSSRRRTRHARPSM